ncbi:MAG: hypothetical protein PUC55_07625 [Lachnospiraceae bacterium]|nr:hypothetical protein [Lachnospiraceae bacterium]
MFLQVMNMEEKEKFLEFVYKIANVDGEYAEEEQEIIDSYKNELELNEIHDTCDIDGLISYFSGKETSLKKIVLFETIGLVYADDKLVKEEEDILNKITATFGLSDEVIENIKITAKKLQDVYDDVYGVLFD